MAEDIDKVERARLARKAIIDHMDCDDCTEDYVFLLRQGGREFGMGLTTVLSGSFPADNFLPSTAQRVLFDLF